MLKTVITENLLKALIEYSEKISLKYTIDLEELKNIIFNYINNGYNDDKYSIKTLKKRFITYYDYRLSTHDICNIYKIKIRDPNFPEDISENIIKFIIRRLDNDPSCYWKGGKDLYSYKGFLECKCFTTDGPISFSPSSNWDFIYFLDATKWREKKFKLYKCKLKNISKKWKDIKVNSTDTFNDHAEEGRRPRISWSSLLPQIKSDVIILFDGNFDEFF